MKFRVVRGDQVVLEGLSVHSLKKFKKDVGKVDKGSECGIALEKLKIDLE